MTEPVAATTATRPSRVPPARSLWRRSEDARRRLAVGAAAGSLGSLVLAAVDAAWSKASGEVGYGALVLGDAGLVAPLGLGVGLGAAVASLAAHERAPTLRALVAKLRDTGAGRQADRAAFVALAALGAFAWLLVAAHLARHLLASDLAPRFVGLGIAAGSLGLAVLAAFFVLALTPGLKRALARVQPRVRAAVDPAATLGVALVLVGAGLAYGVWSGGLSGEGGLFGILGVFKRQELDLRAPGALLPLALGAYLAPALFSGLRRPFVAALLALAPLGLTVHAATSLSAAPDVAQTLERGAPVGKLVLPLARRLTDRDHDGYAALFGGGDCDDHDGGRFPGADEVAGNGLDEDCSGADLPVEALAEARAGASHGPTPTPEAVVAQVPKDGNLVLITVDTLRWDLGYAGYARPITPAIDAFAAHSVVFQRAYALASYTGKSVGPMLIGKYGSETHRNWGHFNRFGTEDTLVAERLKAAGVRTVAVHGHHYFGKFSALDRGFDVVDLSAAGVDTGKWAVDATITSDKITDVAIARVGEAAASGRFYAWVHYLDPHADYLPHPEVASFGAAARDLYDAEVAYTDKHIGRLLSFIAAQPWAAKTSIVLTSDHGESFGERDYWRHGRELWEPIVRVPLVVHVPGAEPHAVDVRRSLIDLCPTIVELMGVPGASGQGDDFFSGTSLLPDLFPAQGQPFAARDVLIDMPAGPFNESRRALIHGDLKLIVSRDAQKELFDLATDPEERRNVWAKRKDEIEAAYAAKKASLREVKVGPDDK
ncbi:MAG: sulfatase [Polyangiaceae bacterium]|nr:sulfatase [Polyangiaceae bacterium]